LIERAIAFDLSSKCIGTTCAALSDGEIIYLKTFSIIPATFRPKNLGWLSTKKTFFTAQGAKYSSYVCSRDEKVTKQEAKARDAKFRDEQRRLKLRSIAEKINEVITVVKPTVLIIEKNMAFNGILTTKQLAEIAGEVHAFAGILKIPLFEYYVQTIRKRYNISFLLKEYCKDKTREELMAIEDKNKYLLKLELLKRFGKYGLNENMNFDESDSLAAFAHWYDFDFGND
jgi:hypothetical protein